MTPAHTLPRRTLLSMARGEDGVAVLRALSPAQHSKHLLLLTAVAARAAERRHPAAAVAADALAALHAVRRAAPLAAETVVRHPAVGSWALAALRDLLHGGPAARPDRLAAVAASAAVLGRVAVELDLRAEADGLTLPGLGRALVPPGRVVLRSDGRDTELRAGRLRVCLPHDRYGETPHWQGLRRLPLHAPQARMRLLTDDVDPYRFPGSLERRSRLPAAELRSWHERLGAGWRLLAGHHAWAAAECAEAFGVLVPLADPPSGYRSATSRAASGCLALSSPPGPAQVAEALAHEAQHAKLAALIDMFDLVRPAPQGGYYAPWRSDPRPLGGLLQGAYAHLGIARFWRRQRELERDRAAAFDAHARYARWRDAAAEVSASLLGSGGLTALGTAFVTEMRVVLASWQRDQVPPDALRHARRTASRHRARWLSEHT
ncbi:HEXXH motif-containing putative peptide modification protein [Spongiactinospora sp. TRM90649]|uniref:aKG-HExxH-type peptide beta-hydroxylase n=1 Tax=Spongiactinospora sp. TRM90649 TaxID=3031114 RepID=UPI0023F9FC29|nr:HEXXH motif-containing putative peptide modification protein [Spongiactinospora sp. TRM90649]MDF5755844.1 HEXXH motif-containing putative peptide modification protein [Spongiactinospora sp. TRM90649]